MKYLQVVLFCLLLSHKTFSAPYQQPSTGNQNTLSQDCVTYTFKILNDKHTGTSKKDVFMSRGWGAGGMPFSVLYMNGLRSSKAPTTERVVEKIEKAPKPQREKNVPQLRNLARQKSMKNASYSVIPQLFVSYGWGPHGK